VITPDDSQESGRVVVHPLGPHFEIRTDDEQPTGLPDGVFDQVHDALVDKLGDLNNVLWVNHIEPHTPFATATWDIEADDPYWVG